jgi:hypothetical protein
MKRKNNKMSNEKRKEERGKHDVYLSDTVLYVCIEHEFVSDLWILNTQIMQSGTFFICKDVCVSRQCVRNGGLLKTLYILLQARSLHYENNSPEENTDMLLIKELALTAVENSAESLMCHTSFRTSAVSCIPPQSYILSLKLNGISHE